MFEEQTLDRRVLDILSNSFRNRVISTLGAMVNVDSEAFYTASDVGLNILQRSYIDIDSLDSYDVRELFGSVSSILSDAYRKGLSEVHRTNKRIHPKLYADGKASYGYRIGYAYRKRSSTPDVIREHKAVASGATSSETRPTMSALEIGEQVISMMDYYELCQLELSIQARKEKLFSDAQKRGQS